MYVSIIPPKPVSNLLQSPLVSSTCAVHPPTRTHGPSAADLAVLLDFSQEAVVVYDCTFRILYANLKAERQLSLSKEALIGSVLWELFPATIPSYYEPLKHAIQERIPLTFEVQHAPNDSWFEGQCVPIEAWGEDREAAVVVFLRDIAYQKSAAEALRDSEGRFLRIIDSSQVAYAINDDHQNITFLNAEFIRTFGYTRDDIPTLADWWPKAYPDPSYRQWVTTTWQSRLERAKQETAAFEAMELTIRCKDGSERTVLAGAAPLGAAFAGTHLVSLYDITDRKRAEYEKDRLLAEAQERADCDPLTSLLNHRAFQKKMADETDRARRESTTLAVVMLDLDNFKFFNDAYGHAVGDKVLRLVAGRLQQVCRTYDTVARFGGDEFALLIPCVGRPLAADIEARLRAALSGLAHHPDAAGAAIPITVSVGVALFPYKDQDRHEVLRQADTRLLRSKTGGAADTEADQVWGQMGRSIEGFSMLDALVTAVDNKDRYTRRHSEDVMEYSVMIARELGMDEAVLQVIGVAALLHDVGKIGVPDAILRKPGILTEEETRVVKQHPMLGVALVTTVPGLEDTLDAVRHHHERWDGGGYPFGLKGEETPLSARLMAVADAFSAMTTDRPYRKGMDRTKALTNLEVGAGTQWDPQCVDAFFKALSRHPVRA
jgi:diguanylate cyclase (GGDEF)-like protein/PAS domain S-box-containing protein